MSGVAVNRDAVVDFNGDGKTDWSIVRSAGIGQPYTWWNQINGSGEISAYQLGVRPQDIPVPADYDGDGKDDLCVAHGFNLGTNPPTPIQWFIRYSSGQPDETVQWGNGINFNFAQGDYDGDGKTDIALWVQGSIAEPQSYFWVRPSSNPSQPIVHQWGTRGDLPTAGYNNR